MPISADAGTPAPDANTSEPDASTAKATFTGIDVLFVINDAPSIADTQEKLAATMNSFFAAIAAAEGGLPDMHVGVISTDMGAGSGGGVSGCFGAGDDGQLQSPPACNVGATFASGSDPVELALAAQCAVQLGEFGCPFEQPLASLQRALDPDNTYNTGFIREDALLVVVVLTDEDDCSATDAGLFTSDKTTALGPLSSFRCFEYGVQCNEPNPWQVGLHTDCRGAETAYMNAPSAFVQMLNERKGPGRVVFSGIMPPASPVEVENPGGGRRALVNVCPTGRQRWPTVRLHDVASGLGDGNTIYSMCDDDWNPAMQALAQRIADVYEPAE